jgi:hypothetical protein
LKAYEHLDEVPPVDFLTPEEEDYLVEEFHKQKFDHSKSQTQAQVLWMLLIPIPIYSFTVLYL